MDYRIEYGRYFYSLSEANLIVEPSEIRVNQIPMTEFQWFLKFLSFICITASLHCRDL